MNQPAERAAAAPATDTTGIRVFAFLYYVAGFLVGVALELIFPTSWLSSDVRLAATLVAASGWLALDIGAIALFGAAGTSIWPMVPSTALVTSGPYRISRNPQYLGIAFFHAAPGGVALDRPPHHSSRGALPRAPVRAGLPRVQSTRTALALTVGQLGLSSECAWVNSSRHPRQQNQ